MENDIISEKKKRNVITTPFLQLDMEKVIRSISKTVKYFEKKIAKYPFLKDKSKILAQVILAQTK